jgi:hypothetical protein
MIRRDVMENVFLKVTIAALQKKYGATLTTNAKIKMLHAAIQLRNGAHY